MEESGKKCACTKQRLYYTLMAAIFLIMIIIEAVALGTFGTQFNNTVNFWRQNIPGANSSTVCILYGRRSSMNGTNPVLTNDGACGFSFWGMVTILIVLLCWMVFHIIMAAFGKPRMFSMCRIIGDLVISAVVGLLSLIVSAVLTAGLRATCAGFGISALTLPCERRGFIVGQTSLQFHRNLSAAQGTSWVITIAFASLLSLYTVLLIVSCFIRRRRKKSENIGTEKGKAKASKKHKTKDEDKKAIQPHVEVEDITDKS